MSTVGPGPGPDPTRPPPRRTGSLGAFLTRGLLAGLIAGLAAFAVAYLVGEPSLAAAIAVEDGSATSDAGATDHHHDDGAAAGHTHEGGHEHEGGTVVPRALQSTVGLATGTLVAGVTLGGFFGLLTAVALGRLGRTGPRATALALTAVGFVAVQLVPFAAYPTNPPGVGDPGTIGLRTGSYALLLAISVIAAVAALLAARSLRPRWGSWYAGLTAGAAYLLVVAVVVALLPGFDEVPADYPAALLYRFRAASLLTQLALWGVLGLALADLTSRLVARPTQAAPTRVPAAA